MIAEFAFPLPRVIYGELTNLKMNRLFHFLIRISNTLNFNDMIVMDPLMMMASLCRQNFFSQHLILIVKKIIEKMTSE